MSNRIIDVIDGGFDGGIRYGGTVPEDMIAQRLSADIRWVVVASPAYLERFGRPAHPDDLQAHRCVRIGTCDDRITGGSSSVATSGSRLMLRIYSSSIRRRSASPRSRAAPP